MSNAASRLPKCLFLHGNPGSQRAWARLIPLLDGVAECAAIDLPGFGRNVRRDTRAESVALPALASAALGALDARGWREPCFVIGHSHGAAVAQTLAVAHPDRVAGIVLLASLGAPAHASYRLLNLPGALSLARFTAWLFHAPSVLSVVQVARGRPCEAIFEAAPRVRCATLFIHGEQDALVPARAARNIHERILAGGGNSEFQTLPGAGHRLIDNRAAQVTQRLTAFLRSARVTP